MGRPPRAFTRLLSGAFCSWVQSLSIRSRGEASSAVSGSGYIPRMSIDWGDAPTWVAGAFAAAAAFYTRGMLKSQREQIDEQREFIREQSANLELERAEFRAQAEDRKRAQAAQVRLTGQVVESGGGVHGPLNETWRARVENRSGEPIKDVVVRYGPSHTSIGSYGRNDPDGHGRNFGIPLAVIGANGTFCFRSPTSSNGDLSNARPTALFTDSAGVRWLLDEHGALSEAPPEPSL